MSRNLSNLSTYNGQSMAPLFVPGDGLIIESYANDDEMQIGDVIAYPHPSDDFDAVHRIVRIDKGKIFTQGDNNDQEDLYELSVNNVKGKIVAVKRRHETINILGGKAGLRHLKQIKKRRKIKDYLAYFLRP